LVLPASAEKVSRPGYFIEMSSHLIAIVVGLPIEICAICGVLPRLAGTATTYRRDPVDMGVGLS
jgi:hypothetical protein